MRPKEMISWNPDKPLAATVLKWFLVPKIAW